MDSKIEIFPSRMEIHKVIPEICNRGSSTLVGCCYKKWQIPEFSSGSSTRAVSSCQIRKTSFNKRQTTQVEDPETSSGILYVTTTQKLKGFTLIELLVVVLIIGILAAVALPKYQIAVQKAHFATFRSLAMPLVRAAQAYHLANGTYPASFDVLDVLLPADMTPRGKCATNSKMFCCISSPIPNQYTGAITCGAKDNSFMYTYTYAASTGEPLQTSSCKEKEGVKVCETLFNGTHHNPDARTLTPAGYVTVHYFTID